MKQGLTDMASNKKQKVQEKSGLLLPSQMEVLEALDDLQKVYDGKSLDTFPSSCKALGLLSILTEAGLTNRPNYFSGGYAQQTGKEFFNYMERNNQVAEEELNQLVCTEDFYDTAVKELASYCQEIIVPEEREVKAPPILEEFCRIAGEECPKAFSWNWGPITLLICPVQSDIERSVGLVKEVEKEVGPVTAILSMHYKISPLKDNDISYGSEIWHTKQSKPMPLSWQERKMLLSMVKNTKIEKVNPRIDTNIIL